MGEYKGVIIEEKNLDTNNRDVMAYAMKIDATGHYIDASKFGGAMHLVNHACESKVIAVPYAYNGLCTVVLVAIEDINRHEQITIDYGWEYDIGATLMVRKLLSIINYL